MKFQIFILMFLVMVCSAFAMDYTIDKYKVYRDDPLFYIDANPHTAWNEEVFYTITSKVYTGDINVLFGFDNSETIPLTPMVLTHSISETNKTLISSYIPLEKSLRMVKTDFKDKNTFYILENIPIVAGEPLNLKFYLQTEVEGKYDVSFYPSSYGTDFSIADSFSSLYELDPWTGAKPTNGQAYYDFEEGAGAVLIDLWNTTNLTVQGMVWNTTTPIFNTTGTGDSFSGWADGNDYVYASSDNFNHVNNFSISFWYKYNVGASAQRFIDISYDPNTGFGSGIALADYDSVGNGGLTFYCWLDDTNKQNYVLDGSYGDNRWRHMVFTKDAITGSTFYLNGTLIGNDGADTSDCYYDATASIDLFTKNNDGLRDDYYTGYMDEFMIFNKTLNITEIRNLFNCGWIECGVINNAPTINLTSPPNGTIEHNLSVAFTFFPYDEDNDTMNCSLYVNGTNVATEYNISGYSPVIYYNLSVWNYNYSWYINCTDGNATTISETWYYLPINRGFVITLLNPANNTNGSLNVNFGLIVNDSDNDNFNCSLFLDDVFSQSGTLSANTSYNFSETLTLYNTTYNWSVNCTDELFYNVSETWFYTTLPASVLNAINETFTPATCPVQSTGISILFSAIVIMSCVFVLIGIISGIGLFLTIGGLLFLAISISLFGCSILIGTLIAGIGFFLMVISFGLEPLGR